ncbi:hypothetical protein NUW54_g1450 [Trametes sanguinea]|uniref:Uncharacterized protein n=1 Tax=Trametes sanguinea TaxID=158606 RepID=A0ACC1Q7N0_9APHY|nr:hypothetical protein NUW54_g1450 [Trametes sanguinea]
MRPSPTTTLAELPSPTSAAAAFFGCRPLWRFATDGVADSPSATSAVAAALSVAGASLLFPVRPRFLKQLIEPHITRLAERRARASTAESSASSVYSAGGHTSGADTTSPVTPEASPALFPGQDPAVVAGHFANLYATDLDVSKAAAELAASGALPAGAGAGSAPARSYVQARSL